MSTIYYKMWKFAITVHKPDKKKKKSIPESETDWQTKQEEYTRLD